MVQNSEKSEMCLKYCFGKTQWQSYFGDIGDFGNIGGIGGIAPLPNNMDAILQSPCPIWEGKKTWETHKLFLVPKSVEGKPLNLNLIGEMVQVPKQGHKAEYLYYSGPVKADIGDSSVEKAHWCLMTKDIIPGSTDKDFRDQCSFMDDLRHRLDLPYAIPSTTEATLCVFLHYVETGERIFARNDAQMRWTFTRCSDEVSAEHWAVAVGGFESRGLLVYRSPDYLFDRHFAGVAGVRRF